MLCLDPNEKIPDGLRTTGETTGLSPPRGSNTSKEHSTAIQRRVTKPRKKADSTYTKGRTRWVARYRNNIDREHSKTFDTEKQAKAWLQEQVRALHREEWIDPSPQAHRPADHGSLGCPGRAQDPRDLYRITINNLGPWPLQGVPA